MSVLPIVKYPDPRLQQRCAQVVDFNAELHQLLENMKETMYVANGVGLAAPQIGVLQQITVVDVAEEGNSAIELINPVITERAGGEIPSEEGCLSIPGYRDTIKRYAQITVNAQDRHGQMYTIQAQDLLAICIQHEVDHLNGKLFIQHLSALKRELFNKWWRKHGMDAEE
jgi:peptide deformylase